MSDRLHGLDLLRGISAVIVLLFHINTEVSEFHLISRGYLAVDFFFVLSGYILSRTYYGVITDNHSRLTFLRKRFWRLQPLVSFGVFLNVVLYLFKSDLHLDVIFLRGLIASFALPDALMMPGSGVLWAINPVLWSMFWEYVASFLFAFVFLRMPISLVICILIICVIGSVIGGLFLGSFDLGHRAGEFWFGGFRSISGFLLGMLSFHFFGKFRLFCSTLLIPITLLLFVCALPYKWLPGEYDVLLAFLVFPICVISAACINFESRISSWFGEVSYPLYVTHFAVLRLLVPVFSATWIDHLILFVSSIMFAQLTINILDGRIRRGIAPRPKPKRSVP